MNFRKLIAYLSFLVPQSWLSTEYMADRVWDLAGDPETCDHDWWVVASIISTVELQVQCQKCATYSEVPDPTKEEWEKSYDAMENPYPWRDKSRISFYRTGDRDVPG